jgi:RNA polymerase sigma-70 factor (ECF subfamily)
MNTTLTATHSASLSSTTIFERLSRGEAGAYEDLVERYGKLVTHLLRRGHGWRIAELDDAVQDAMMAIWRAAPNYDCTLGAESTYIGTIVRRLMINRHRRAARSVGQGGQRWEHGADALELAQVKDTGDAGRGCPDEARQLYGAMDQLKPQDRALFELAVVGGKTQAQIAQSTGLSRKTVRKIMLRVLARLRRDLIEHPRKAAA